MVDLLRRLSHWATHSESTFARWMRAARAALFGEMPELAAGTAFFAVLATVPTLAAVVAIYGAIADPNAIHGHLKSLNQILPPDVLGFVASQLQRQAERSSGEATLTIAGSAVAAVYSARGGADAMIDVLNRAYRVREKRGTLRRLGITIGMASGTLVGLMVMAVVIVGMPTFVAFLDLKGYGLVRTLRWPVLMVMVFVSQLALYRYGPSPRPLVRRHLWPGALLATLVWMAVSWGLSVWVERVADYAFVYGAFGSVIVVLLWFYLSVLAIVLGGFVNAELERGAGAPAPDREMY